MVQTAVGGGITFAGKLFTFACRLVITFLLARLLGATQYGMYNLALTALTLAAALAAFGLDTTMVRYVATFRRRGDEARLWGTIQIGLGISLGLSVLLGIGLYALAHPIAVELFNEPGIVSLLQLASLVVPFLVLNTVAAAITEGFKKMQYATMARDVVQPALRLILIVALVLLGASAIGALAVYGVAVAVSGGLLLFLLHKRLFALRRPLGTAQRETKAILGFSLPVFLSDLMMTFRENIQVLLLGALNTVSSVGIFAVANQVNMVGSMFQSAIATASRPIIAELHDKGDWPQMARMYQTTTKWTVSANLPIFLTLVLFPTEILSIFGKSFVTGSAALVLLACAIMINIGTGQCGLILDMTGRTGWKLTNAIIRLVLSIGSSALLIPPYGIVGAAVSALIAMGGVNIIRLVQVFMLYQLLPYNASFVKPLAAGAAALLCALAVHRALLGSSHALAVGLAVAALFGVYISVVLVLGLSPEDRIVLAGLRKRFPSVFGRNGNHDHQPHA